MPSKSWTDSEFKFVFDLWSKGYSPKTIGMKLGRTRNAIIGRLHREGLSDRDRPVNVQVKPKPEVVAVLRKAELRPTSSLPRVRLSPTTDIPDDPEFPRSKALAFNAPADQAEFVDALGKARLPKVLLLKVDDCRYPIGDVGTPDFKFCSNKRLDDHPYCRTHLRLCYSQVRLAKSGEQLNGRP